MTQKFGSTTRTAVPIELYEQLLTAKRGERVRIKSVKQIKGLKAARVYYTVDGGRGAHWDMPNNDLDSVVHGILERVYYVKINGEFQSPPKPRSRDHVKETLNRFRARMKDMIGDHGRVAPVSEEKFLSRYSGQKRKIYEQAIESLKTRPLDSRDGKVKCFTKDEYRKAGGAPRVIQPRSPRFNVRWGRYIQAIEEPMYEAIDRIYDPTGETKTVAKGMNMLDRGMNIADKWSRYASPVGVGLDAKRFDQHVSKYMLEQEMDVYAEWLDCLDDGEYEAFWTLAITMLQNHGSYVGRDGKVKYVTDGRRMSGDMNTSSGNILIMCALLWTYIQDSGLSGQVSVLNDGDDSVIIMEKRNLKKFLDNMEPWFKDLGFSMSLDGIYYSLEEIEFCQSRPVHLNRGWTLVPKPSKRLFSDLVTTKQISSKKVYEAWLGAVAGCGLAGCSGVPVFNSFYKWLARGAVPYIPQMGNQYYRYRQELVKGMQIKAREPAWSERESFYFAYGLTPSDQKLLEDYFDSRPDPVWTPIIGTEDLVQQVTQTMPGALNLLDVHFADRYGDMVI